MRPLPPVGAMWADATKGLPVDDLDQWREAWCDTCRHGTQACPLSGVLDTGYTPAQITSSLEAGTECSHHSPTGHLDVPVSPPAMPHTGTGRPSPRPRPVPFIDTYVSVARSDQGDPEVVQGDGGTGLNE